MGWMQPSCFARGLKCRKRIVREITRALIVLSGEVVVVVGSL
jgi:hypothetical protein